MTPQNEKKNNEGANTKRSVFQDRIFSYPLELAKNVEIGTSANTAIDKLFSKPVQVLGRINTWVALQPDFIDF